MPSIPLPLIYFLRFSGGPSSVKRNQIPAFLHITTASVHDMNAMDVIPYEQGSYYSFDRGYNDFKRLFKIQYRGCFLCCDSKEKS